MARNESHKSSQQLMIQWKLDSMQGIRLTCMSYFTLDESCCVQHVGSVLTFTALMAGFANK